jgi:protein phosphatase
MTRNLISIPEYCLVLLVGPTGSGKSSFAAKHFRPTEVVSSDDCRGIVSDDANDQAATADAFELLHYIVAKRLKGRRLTVVDATNVKPEDRASLIRLGRDYHALTVAFVFNIDAEICIARNRERPDRPFGGHVVRNHARALRRGLKRMRKEGIRFQYRFASPEEVDAVDIERQRLWTDRRDETGPFDIIGDVHGCADELETLLKKLGYLVERAAPGYKVEPPSGRRAIFVGDLVDRGPRVPDVLRLVRTMVDAGHALCVAGNHENKLVRALDGRNVKVSHGLAESLEQLGDEDPDFVADTRAFLDGLISHYVLDGGDLVVAHAGIREDMQGRSSGAVRSFCLYGETTGETDEFGLPVRYDWARDYRGKAKVIYGHTPVPEAEWVNSTICIDTGCVFGGRLTALRYPELELVDVSAARVYCEPVRPLQEETTTPDGEGEAQRLFLEDVTGKRMITMPGARPIAVSAEQSAAALEVVSRFGVDPRWLIHLPPTMSPGKTSSIEGFLERPEEAFEYFRGEGVARVICEEKHMGSRALMVVCRDEAAAARRFGAVGQGAIYTRTGRAFFPTKEEEMAVLRRTAAAAAGLFDELKSDWLLFDAEILPWSLKAAALLEEQYAAVGAAAATGLEVSTKLLEQAIARGVDLAEERDRIRARRETASLFRAAYRPYVWHVESTDDIRIAAFHLLASEGAEHFDKDHEWHMRACHALTGSDGMFLATRFRTVELEDKTACAAAVSWWKEMTSNGGEGMVVKPFDFVQKSTNGGLVQPALKVRGKEYLRIIYGPDYDLPDNLSRLRSRGLGKKRSLALREFRLGREALRRFVTHEPLRRVHECAVAVLAMESDPVDPRL